jgi:transposase
MSFIRKIKKKGRVYLAEVENQWVDGKVVQKHIRYIGREADGETVLASSLSHVEVEDVKLFGPLLVLDYLAKEIEMSNHLGEYGPEIMSLVYAHCLDYRSINKMERWFARTDLAMLLPLEGVTERRLLDALDSLEQQDARKIQQDLFQQVKETYRLMVSGIVYDVTNTYLYGKKCPQGKLGHDKEGVKGRPLIQIGLAVTKNEGIPICHKVFDGNVHDARTYQDIITHLRDYKIRKGLVVYDRGIVSAKNLEDTRALHWDTVCGLPIRGKLVNVVRSLIEQHQFIQIPNRVRLNKTIFYAVKVPHQIEDIDGTLTVCFNEQQQRELRESRYDEVLHARDLVAQGKVIKAGLEKYFSPKGVLLTGKIKEAEEFDGYSCIFSTAALSKEEMIRLYFDKDLVEKAFRTIKGVTRLRPIRHWLYNRVDAHVFICYLSYMLLSLLRFRLRKLGVSPEEALLELDSLYKVYLRDKNKGFELSRVVSLTKQQEAILKAISRRLLKY